MGLGGRDDIQMNKENLPHLHNKLIQSYVHDFFIFK